MEYAQLQLVPTQDGGWQATIMRKSTRAVQGHPTTKWTRQAIKVEALDGCDVDDVLRTLLRVCGVEDGHQRLGNDLRLPPLSPVPSGAVYAAGRPSGTATGRG